MSPNSQVSDHKSSIDKTLLVTAVLLMLVGILMVYSASNAISRDQFDDSYLFLKKQVLWCCIGLAIVFLAMFFKYQNYMRLAWPLLIVSAFFLILVYIPGIGIKRGGGMRWVDIGLFSFQPVELAKLALVIFMAQFLTRKEEYIKDFKRGVLPALAILSLFFILIYRQPDFGSVILIGTVALIMLFAGGAKTYQVALIVLVAALVVSLEIWREPYRLRRWMTFLHPWEEAEGAGYQIVQSFYAFGSGGILGTGLGAGMQKLHYLPAPHTDFILSVIGEELGFVGSLFITLLFMVILWRGMHISLSTEDRFGSLLALGIASLIGLQSIINIGVVTGALPTKGLTLPFISFGGSSMLVSSVSIGILLNISRKRSNARH